MIADAEMDRAVRLFVAMNGGGEYPTLANPMMRHCLVAALHDSDEFAGIWYRADDAEREAIAALVAEEFCQLAQARALFERSFEVSQ